MVNSLLAHRSSRRQLIKHAALASFGSTAILQTLSTWSARASAATVARRVSVVGDSLTVSTLPYQAKAFVTSGWMGSAFDAYVSRGIRTKVAAIPTGLTAVGAPRAAHGDTAMWVVALGTNDAGIYRSSLYPTLIEQMLDRIGETIAAVGQRLPSKAMPHQITWNQALAASRRAADRVDDL
jgi:hypothetical protein